MEYDVNNVGEERPAFLYLNQPLAQAVINGDEAAVSIELEGQDPNETTIAISNHLKMRDFLLHQKLQLIKLHESLFDQHEIENKIWQCISDLNERFAGDFISEDKNSMYCKLADDSLFREAMLNIADYIAKIDTNELRTPQELLHQAALWHNALIHALERVPAEVVAGYWGDISSKQVLESVIESEIAAIDWKINDSMIVQTRQPAL